MKNSTPNLGLSNNGPDVETLIVDVTSPTLQKRCDKTAKRAKRIIQKSRKAIISALGKLHKQNLNAEKIMIEAIVESNDGWEFLGYPIELLNNGLEPSAAKNVEVIAVNYLAIAQQQRNLHGVAFGINNIVPFGA